MTRLRTRRIEHLHQPLERHIRMRERIEIHPADLVEELRERHATVDRRPQHQRVDEHADQIIERSLTTTRDRRTDRNIGTRAQPRQQHRQAPHAPP